MADTTTGTPVQTLTGQFVSTKLVDSGGSNVGAIDASGRLAINIGAVGGTAVGATQPLFVELSTGAAAYTLFGQTQATAPYQRISDGTTVAGVIAGTTALKTDLSSIAGTAPSATAYVPARLTDGAAFFTKMGQTQATAPWTILSDGTTQVGVKTVTGGALSVAVVDGSGAQITSFGGGTQYVGDAAATSTPTGTVSMGLANAAAPSDVSANNDAVAQWFLRNGSSVVNLASGGTLITIGQKTAANGLPVTLASDQASATAPLHVVLGTGAADYTLFGQAVASAPYSRITDGVTVAGVIAGTTALKADLSSVAGTATVTGGINGIQAVAGGIAADAAVGAQNPLYAGARGSSALPTAMSTDGDLTPLWATLNGSLNVVLRDTSGTYVSMSNTQYVGDAAITATPTGTVSMGLAHAAAPADVSADNDAVAAWFLRNGSQVVNLASGSTLITLGSKVSASSLPVVIASDQGSIAVTPASNSSVNVSQWGGQALAAAAYPSDAESNSQYMGNQNTFPMGWNGTTWDRLKSVLTGYQSVDLHSVGGVVFGPTAFVPNRLTDGAAYYTKTGQTAGTAAYMQLSDQTNTAAIIAGTNALKTDMSSIVGTVPGATNPLPVRLTDGAAFYSAAAGTPSSPHGGPQTSAALGAGASVRLNHYVTSGKTGRLYGVDVASTVPLKVEIQTILTGTPTTKIVLFSPPFTGLMWRTPSPTFITQTSADASSGFSVTVTNKDAATAADVYSSGWWDEV